MRRVTIDPISRLEGHGKIEIFLNEQGNVENAYLQIPELRGFEQFVVGRHVEDMPIITQRICGVCPEAHHLAAVKALDGVFGVVPNSAATKLRELLYSAFFVADHTTHFYALGGPDFIVGPEAPPLERNILGVFHKVGLDVAKQVIACRQRNHNVIKMIGGRGLHPTGGLPGGWSKPLSQEDRVDIEKIAKENIEFALFSLKTFDDIVLKNPTYLSLVTSEIYYHETYYMGLVDANNCVNFYDGNVRIIAPDGSEFAKYEAKDYAQHIAEIVFSWSYLKFPYLKQIGWKGFVGGMDSGVYCATPLARLNCSDKMATPKAQEQFESMYQTFGCKKVNGKYQPIHFRLATHWARLIELLYAAERMLELATDPEIISPNVRVIPKEIVGEGIGCVEAPRGTLTHHYVTDKNGIVTKANLIVGTTNNYAPISMSIKKAAQKLIINGNVQEGLLNKVEMAFRLYDPCFSCATHNLPGKMPLEIDIHDAQGKVMQTLRRDL